MNVAPEDAGGADQVARLVGSEPAHVVLAEPQRTGFVHRGQRTHPLCLAAHEVDRAALGEMAVDALARRGRPDDVDRSCIALRIARIASGPCRRASAASDVANSAEHQPPLRPDAPKPATSRSTTAMRRDGSASASECAVHRPVKPAPTMHTSTCRSWVRAGRGGSGAGTASHHSESRWYPEAAPRRYIRRHASERTSRSVDAMKSISSCPQISGGDSWTTGSPRSSARQISPASKSAPER